MRMLKLSLLLILVMALSSCQNNKKTVNVSDEVKTDSLENLAGLVYKIDTFASVIEWEGAEGLAAINTTHNGTMALYNGELQVKDNELIGGKFNINLPSLKVLDIPAEKAGNAKLKRHLLSDDFFDVEKFKDAGFEITSINKSGNDSMKISGNLTLKGVSKNIDIMAKVTVSENEIQAETKQFYFNRKDWGMSYGTEKSLGDEMIRPEVGIKIKLLAKK